MPLSSTFWAFGVPCGRLHEQSASWLPLAHKTISHLIFICPRAATAKVSIKGSTSKGSRRAVSLSPCFPMSSPASILQHMHGCTQDAWAGKGPTSTQSPLSVTVTLSRAFLARWRKIHASLHVCLVNKGNGYRVHYILSKLVTISPPPPLLLI